jgi:tRNA (Thr-GGU) A37 N-methylase
VKNFFVDEVAKVARYAVPFARNLKRMIGPSRIKTKKIDRTNGMPLLDIRPNERTEKFKVEINPDTHFVTLHPTMKPHK